MQKNHLKTDLASIMQYKFDETVPPAGAQR